MVLANNNLENDTTEICRYHDNLQEAAEYIKSHVSLNPRVLVICGSGLGSFCDHIEEPHALRYQDIPNAPVSKVPGHENLLVYGKINGVPIVSMRGRVHFYEGYSMREVVFFIRCLHLCGVKTLVVTSAVGSVNKKFQVGDLMLIRDHINLPGLVGFNTLIGKNDDSLGPRFPVMSGCYDRILGNLFKESAIELGYGENIREGVMGIVSGPTFETPAEVRFLRLIGADSVGMSVGPEVISARHCGMCVIGINLVTNKCVDVLPAYDDTPQLDGGEKAKIDSLHSVVVEVAKKSSERLSKIIFNLFKKMPAEYYS